MEKKDNNVRKKRKKASTEGPSVESTEEKVQQDELNITSNSDSTTDNEPEGKKLKKLDKQTSNAKQSEQEGSYYSARAYSAGTWKLGNFNMHKKEHLFCYTCHMEITGPQDMQEHFTEDKSTRKYICKKCSRGFSNFTKLIQHIGRQHGADENYQCRLCEERESKEPTGVGYICCVCDVMFDFIRDLEDHMASHESI